MIGLLVAVVYWLGMFWAACGVVVLAAFLWMLVADWLEEMRWRDDQRRMGKMLAATVPPYDWNDPLERWFLLPDAPEPKWLVG